MIKERNDYDHDLIDSIELLYNNASLCPVADCYRHDDADPNKSSVSEVTYSTLQV